MPVIKSAIKRVKQTKVKTEQNRHYKTRMLTFYKKISKLAATGESKIIESLVPEAFSAIDTATKKGIIHKNNAARKKSRIARLAVGVVKKEKVDKPKPTSPKVEFEKEPAIVDSEKSGE